MPFPAINLIVNSVNKISRRANRARPFICGTSLVFLLTACLPEFPNLEGEYIRSSSIEDVIAETEALTVRSPMHYKALYFHMNRHMRLCLEDKPNARRGYILDSVFDEDMERGELATVRDKTGFGYYGETYVLIQSGAVGSKVVIHTREDFQLEKWMKWIGGERGCFPELMG